MFCVDTYGGGMYSAGTLTIRNSILQNNTARDGGGLYIKGGPLPLIVRTSVTGNTPNDIASAFE